jgi:iron complex transport system substrate-binding protein
MIRLHVTTAQPRLRMRALTATAAAAALVVALLVILPAAAAPATEGTHARPAARIVSLAPHLTELVYSAGAGALIVGADAYSDYPDAARKLPRVGDAFQVDYERLLALQPDLVLVWDSGTPEAVIERLTGMRLRVERVHTSHLEDIARAIERIGELAGTQATARQHAGEFLADVARLREQSVAENPVRVFYQVTEKPLYTVSGDHLISEVIGLCGGHNIFDDLEQLAPVVSLEAVLARDPEAIITADGAQGDPLSVWRKWPRLRAVSAGNLHTVDADKIARSTTRIIEGARQVCGAIAAARARRASS